MMKVGKKKSVQESFFLFVKLTFTFIWVNSVFEVYDVRDAYI